MAGTGTAHLRDDPLLRIEHLVVEYRLAHGDRVHAVSDVSLDLLEGETLGLVGESGCGKSTIGRAVVRHVPATSGRVWFEGRDVLELGGQQLRDTRVQLQMIFQDPVSSLNPRRTVEKIIGEGLRLWGRGTRAEQVAKVRDTMEAVGLAYEPEAGRRRHQFSGGQCQRISIARSLVLDPKVVVCDEPVASLDVSVQAQILNLLKDMKDRYGLSLVFISHDLSVVKHISDRIAVMYMGKICEVADAEALHARPRHPYTAALLAAIPVPDVDRPPAHLGFGAGDIPSAISPPSGCRFRTRCPRAQQRCAQEEPTIRPLGADQYVACHFPMASDPAPGPGAGASGNGLGTTDDVGAPR